MLLLFLCNVQTASELRVNNVVNNYVCKTYSIFPHMTEFFTCLLFLLNITRIHHGATHDLCWKLEGVTFN